MKRLFLLFSFLLSFSLSAQTAVTGNDLLGNWKPLKYEIKEVATVEKDTIIFAAQIQNLSEGEIQSLKESLKKESSSVFTSSLSFKENNSFLVVMFKDGKKKEVAGTYEIPKGGKELHCLDNKGKKEVFTIVSFEKNKTLVLSQKNPEGVEVAVTYKIY